MAHGKLTTEIVSENYRILVAGSRSILQQEVTHQLAYHKEIEIVSYPFQSTAAASNVDVIFFFAAINKTFNNLEFFRSSLLNLLEIAKKNNSRFFLLVPQVSSLQTKAAVELLTQFVKKDSLNYQIIEVSETENVVDEAEAVVRKIVKNHQAQTRVSVVTPPPQTSVHEVISAFNSGSKSQIITPSHLTQTHPKTTPRPTNPTLPTPLKISGRSILKYFSLAFSIAIIPWVLTLAIFLVTPLFLECSYTSLTSGLTEQARLCSDFSGLSSRSLNIFSKFSAFSPQFFSLAGYSLDPTVSAFTHLSDSLTLSSDLIGQYGSLFYQFLGHTNKDISLDTIQLTYQLSSLSEQLAYLQSDLRDLYLSSSNPPAIINQTASKVASVQLLISKIQRITPDIPKLLSSHQKSTYLFLIQDDTELRPTGGFIDSFILATIDNGRISDIQLFPSSVADSRLKGQVEPPSDMKTILGESSWYLRDSNWNPDFAVSAQKAAWFVDKELSRPVDVVVAINWSTLKEFLKLTGPLTLPDSKVTVNNINVVNEYITNVRPTDNSTGQSFITELTQQIINKSTNFTPTQLTSLLIGLIKQADSRQILIYPTSFNSPELKTAGWNGEVAPGLCLSPNACTQDYFYIVHTNVGINKSNYYVSPTSLLSVKLSPTKIDYSLNVKVENHSPQSSWPTGKYSDYLRVYLPSDFIIDSLQVNGQEKPLSQYPLTSQNGQSLLGILIEVPPSQATVVTLLGYRNVQFSGSFHYQYNLPNEPGVVNDKVSLDIAYPPNWSATTYQQPTVASAGHLQYNATNGTKVQVDTDFFAND